MSIQVQDESEMPPEKTLSRRKLKTKQKNIAKPNKVKLNEKAMRADLEREDAFITSLLMFLPRNQQSESLLSDNTVKKVDVEGKLNHMKETRPELFGSETRVKNYAELRQRIQNRLQQFKTPSKRNKLSKEEMMEQKKLKKKEALIRRKEVKLKKQNHAKGNVKVTAENKPYIEKEGKMVFSRFDFSEKQEKGPSKKPDYHQLLKQIEENKAKVADLKEKGEHQATVQTAAWDKAMTLSEGKKVLDDPELIKKSIKMAKKKREKSKAAWEKREADLQYTKEKRLQKRESNIKGKKDEKKARNLKKLRKHGRLIPGF